MQDFPTEFNLSVWNPPGAGQKAMDKDTEPEKEEAEGDKESKK